MVRQISLTDDLVDVAHFVAMTPFSGDVALVGGYVRDQLLGLEAGHDADLVTTGDAIALAQALRQAGIARIEPVVYPRFGTALIMVGETQVELVTARRESYAPDSRKPFVEVASLEEDARRRDFTVNTLMAKLPRDGVSTLVQDPLGQGLDDLAAKILRTPLDPKATFDDDPLRMLRAVRFRAQLGFEFALGLPEAIRESSERLRIVSRERVRDELSRMLLLPCADQALEDLMELGLMPYVIPELTDMPGVTQGDFHHLDAWDHTRLVVKQSPSGDLVTRLAALLHDVGKPQTRTIDEAGRTRFFGHEQLGAEMAGRILRDLRYGNEIVLPVQKLVKHHMRFTGDNVLSNAACRRLIRDLGDDLGRLLDLVEADAASLKPGVRQLDLTALRKKLADIEIQTPRETLKSPLTGEEIMSILGVQPGAAVGQAKDFLANMVIEGALSPDDKSEAERRLRTFAATIGEEGAA